MGKVDLIKDRCIGCGACMSIAPENFTFSDDGRAEIINNTLTDEAKEASEMCPVSAITIDCGCDCNCENDCKCENECNCACNENSGCTCGDNCNCTEEHNCGCI